MEVNRREAMIALGATAAGVALGSEAIASQPPSKPEQSEPKRVFRFQLVPPINRVVNWVIDVPYINDAVLGGPHFCVYPDYERKGLTRILAQNALIDLAAFHSFCLTAIGPTPNGEEHLVLANLHDGFSDQLRPYRLSGFTAHIGRRRKSPVVEMNLDMTFHSA